ncbi:TonB-dependent receptor domain-containing protein [Maricaulaceae bacterium MS644]
MMTRIQFLPVLAMSLAGLAAPSHAQTEARSRNDETVLVTGLRTATPAETSPASVTVIGRDDIELQGLATLADALAAAPGVEVVQSGPAGSLTSVFIRGANAKHTLALYDGIRLNDPSTATGVFNFGSELLGDASRIEVVRGPLSSLYGSDAVGGVINILPRTGPDQGFEPFAAASFGQFNTTRVLAGVGAGAARMRGAVSAEIYETDGFDVTPARISTATGDPDGARFVTLSANGSLDLTQTISVDLLARLREAEVEFDTFSGGPGGSQRADDRDLESHDDQALVAAGLTAGWLAGAGESRLRAGRLTYDLESFNNRALTDTYEAERDFVMLSNSYRADLFKGVVFSFGADWREERVETDTAFNAPLAVSETVASAYAAAQADLTAAFSLTVSARHDAHEGFDDETTANIGAVYAIAPLNTRLRASFGTSFKAPTLSERFASSAFVTPNPDLSPETGETFEVGFDTALALSGREDALSFGAAYYDGEIENLIENVFDFTTFTGTNRNIGAAELSGWEAYAAWSPADTVTVSGSYTYTDALNADTGQRLLRRPEHAASLSATWRPIEIAALTLTGRHVGERVDVTYDDDGFFVSSRGTADAYQTVDVSGVLDLGTRAKLFLTARNLFDETYEQPAAFAGAPRAVTIGVRFTP